MWPRPQLLSETLLFPGAFGSHESDLCVPSWQEKSCSPHQFINTTGQPSHRFQVCVMTHTSLQVRIQYLRRRPYVHAESLICSVCADGHITHGDDATCPDYPLARGAADRGAPRVWSWLPRPVFGSGDAWFRTGCKPGSWVKVGHVTSPTPFPAASDVCKDHTNCPGISPCHLVHPAVSPDFL